MKFLLLIFLAFMAQAQACLVFWATWKWTFNTYEAHLIDNGVEVCSANGRLDTEPLELNCISGQTAYIHKNNDAVVWNRGGEAIQFQYTIDKHWTTEDWWANNYGCRCDGFKCSKWFAS